jgi:hypothetical protein
VDAARCHHAERETRTHLNRPAHGAFGWRGQRRQHDELQHERGAEDHDQPAEKARSIRSHGECLHEQRHQHNPRDQRRHAGLRHERSHELCRGREHRHEHAEAVQVGERRAPTIHQPFGRERAATNEQRQDRHAGYERPQRRRHNRDGAAGPNRGREHDRQEQQREDDRFADRCHFRLSNTRSGLKSDASVRSPASSSAFNSSAVHQ